MRVCARATLVAVWACVSTTTWAGTVTLQNGDVITGDIVEQTESRVVIDHPQLGRLELDRSDVEGVEDGTGERSSRSLATESGVVVPAPPPEPEPEPESGPETASEAAQGPEEEPKPKGGLFGTPLLRGWNNSLGAGLSGSLGGFEDTKVNVLFRTGKVYEREERREWDVDSAYFLNLAPQKSDDEAKATKNQGFGQLRHKWFLRHDETDERWWNLQSFLVARTRVDFDQFQPWDARVAFSGGPGVFLVNTESFRLSINGGFGYSYAFGSVQRNSPEFTMGIDFTWRLAGWSVIESTNQAFGDMARWPNGRTVHSLNWHIDPGEPGGMGIRFGALYRFDSVSEGRANDLTYLTSLTYNF